MEFGPSSVGANARWRSRRHRGLRRARLLAIGGLTFTLATSGASAAATPAGGDFSLVVDRQTALFQVAGLTPGPLGSQCLRVETRNGAADHVVLSAEVGGTGLADYLDLEIEAGTATDPASCGGFSGASVFAGSLAALGRDHGVPTAGVSIPLDEQAHVVLRFTVVLLDDNQAQGKTATARFAFDAQDISPPGSTTVPETTAPATTVPETSVPAPSTTPGAVAPTTVELPTTTAVATTVTSIGPGTTTAPATTADTDGRDTGAGARPTVTSPPPAVPSGQETPILVVGDDAPASVVEQVGEAARAVARVTATAAGVTARTGAVPGVFSTMVFGFLLLQARMDRRDPKLASAPLAPEPELEFRPRRPLGGTGGVA